jgi:hypothetical protein
MPYVATIKREDPLRIADTREIEAMVNDFSPEAILLIAVPRPPGTRYAARHFLSLALVTHSNAYLGLGFAYPMGCGVALGCSVYRHRVWILGTSFVVGATVLAAQQFIAAYAQDGLPLFQRRQADQQACLAAIEGVAQLSLSPKVASSECTKPKVTPELYKPGRLIVTLRAAAPSAQAVRRVAYSVLVDGRGNDAWRVLQIQVVPDDLILEVLDGVLDSRTEISLPPSSPAQSAVR